MQRSKTKMELVLDEASNVVQHQLPPLLWLKPLTENFVELCSGLVRFEEMLESADISDQQRHDLKSSQAELLRNTLALGQRIQKSLPAEQMQRLQELSIQLRQLTTESN